MRRWRRLVMLVVGGALPGLLSLPGAMTAMAADRGDDGHGNAIYVSPSGLLSHSGRSCETARYSSINAAVAAAQNGGTVVVCRGTYHEDVLVNKPLTLSGTNATIDATGLEDAVWIVRSHVRVSGFKLKNANGEGVLVGVDSPNDAAMLPSTGPVISDVTIQDNWIVNDNKGFTGTEVAGCKYPGDCGGGIHFNVTTHSVIRGNHVIGNADGMLLTDDYGPNSYNVIEDNVVTDNINECGITLPSHNPGAVNFDPLTGVVTKRNPSVGGVYGNIVRDNVVDRNGTAPAPPLFGGVGGSGAGIGIFASGPGFGAYDNVIEDNEASGNGLAGITIHSHHAQDGSTGGDVSGNRLVGNRIGTNNVAGDPFDGPSGPMILGVTVGIAVFSANPNTLTITDNFIHDDQIGIWVSTVVTAKGLGDNEYRHVTTKVVRA